MAMLDHLTNGRLEIGVVSGIPPELAVVGITPEIAAARHAEASDVLDAAFARPVISHHGQQWHFDDLEILPRFLQQPSPPVWTAVRSAGVGGEGRATWLEGLRRISVRQGDRCRVRRVSTGRDRQRARMRA